jgi:hypothetical protein
MKLIKLFIWFLFALFISTGQSLGDLANSPWPMYRRDTPHTGCGVLATPASQNLKWKYLTEARLPPLPLSVRMEPCMWGQWMGVSMQ